MSESAIGNESIAQDVIITLPPSLPRKGKKKEEEEGRKTSVDIHFFCVGRKMEDDEDLEKEYKKRGLRFVGPNTIIEASLAASDFSDAHTISGHWKDEQDVWHWIVLGASKPKRKRRILRNRDDHHLNKVCWYVGVSVDYPGKLE